MSGRDAHRQMTTAMSVVLVIVGLAILVRTVTAGGGPLATGILIGVLFVAAGSGRLWVTRRTR